MMFSSAFSLILSSIINQERPQPSRAASARPLSISPFSFKRKHKFPPVALLGWGVKGKGWSMKPGSGSAIRAQHWKADRSQFWGRFAVVCPDEVPPQWGDYCSCQEWKGGTIDFTPTPGKIRALLVQKQGKWDFYFRITAWEIVELRARLHRGNIAEQLQGSTLKCTPYLEIKITLLLSNSSVLKAHCLFRN